MRFSTRLEPAILVRRYKRFLADVELPSGEVVTVHCPNPGAMTGLKSPGSRVYLSKSDNPKRKLSRTLELVEADGVLVGINTGHPNRLAREAIEDSRIQELDGYSDIRSEVRYGKNSRIDLLLSREGQPDCFVEVKNVHLCRSPGLMEFPDSVTKRGAKHLAELADMVRSGCRAVMLFVIQRGDGECFKLARDIDPAYGLAFDNARSIGVEMLAYDCAIAIDGISILRRVLIDESGKRPHLYS